MGSPPKLGISRVLQLGGTHASRPSPGTEFGTAGANLVGFRSSWGLGDSNPPVEDRGTTGFHRYKLQHHPWSLPDVAKGPDSWVDLVLSSWKVRSLVGYQVEVLRTQNRGGIL